VCGDDPTPPLRGRWSSAPASVALISDVHHGQPCFPNNFIKAGYRLISLNTPGAGPARSMAKSMITGTVDDAPTIAITGGALGVRVVLLSVVGTFFQNGIPAGGICRRAFCISGTVFAAALRSSSLARYEWRARSCAGRSCGPQ